LEEDGGGGIESSTYDIDNNASMSLFERRELICEDNESQCLIHKRKKHSRKDVISQGLTQQPSGGIEKWLIVLLIVYLLVLLFVASILFSQFTNDVSSIQLPLVGKIFYKRKDENIIKEQMELKADYSESPSFI